MISTCLWFLWYYWRITCHTRIKIPQLYYCLACESGHATDRQTPLTRLALVDFTCLSHKPPGFYFYYRVSYNHRYWYSVFELHIITLFLEIWLFSLLFQFSLIPLPCSFSVLLFPPRSQFLLFPLFASDHSPLHSSSIVLQSVYHEFLLSPQFYISSMDSTRSISKWTQTRTAQVQSQLSPQPRKTFTVPLHPFQFTPSSAAQSSVLIFSSSLYHVRVIEFILTPSDPIAAPFRPRSVSGLRLGPH